jgi:hypothetical protein
MYRSVVSYCTYYGWILSSSHAHQGEAYVFGTHLSLIAMHDTAFPPQIVRCPCVRLRPQAHGPAKNTIHGLIDPPIRTCVPTTCELEYSVEMKSKTNPSRPDDDTACIHEGCNDARC